MSDIQEDIHKHFAANSEISHEDGENKENGGGRSKISVTSEEIGRMIKLVFPGSLWQKRRFDNGFGQKTRNYGYTDLDKNLI